MRQGFWLILAGIAVLLFMGSGSIPLMDPDEARFARTSVEMLRGEDPVVPMFEGKPRLVKPPLVHWIQASLFRILGVSSLTARLHTLLAAIGSLIVVGWVARRRFGDEAALWAVACLGTIPLFLVTGKLATLDALLSLHVLAVIALDMVEPESPSRHRGWLTGALLGLAFLIKGPVGVVVPLLVILAGRTAAGRNVMPSWPAVWQAVAGWALVSLPWALALIGRMGWDRVGETVRAEALERYFAGTVHVEPPWFYLLVILGGVLPWSGVLVLALVRLIGQRDEERSPTARYAAAGLIAGLVFFSIGKSKLPTYILPLMPLIALLVTWELNCQLKSPRWRWPAMAVPTGTLALFAVALGLAATRLDGAVYARSATIAAGIFGLGAAIALVGALRDRPRQVFAATAAAAALFLGVVTYAVVPELSLRRTAAYLIEEVPQLRDGGPVLVVDMKVPSMTHYLDAPPESVDMALLERRLEQDDDPLLVFDRADLAATPKPALAQLMEVGSQGKYVVFRKRGQVSF